MFEDEAGGDGSSKTGPWAGVNEYVKHINLFQFNSGSLFSTSQMQFAFMDGLCSVPREKERSSDLEFWINRAVASPGTMAKYQALEKQLRKERTGSDEIDWTDLRIREYKDAEVTAVMSYQKARVGYLKIKDFHDVCHHL